MKLILAIAFGVFILSSSSINNEANALSCTRPMPSIEQAFEDSGVVFLGEVISKEYFPAKISKFEDSIVKFKLIESFKGFSNETMTVKTSEWFYNPIYEVGNDNVVFAFGQPGKALSHKLCTIQSMMPEEKNLEQLRLLSEQEPIFDFEKGLEGAIKLAQERDQMRFLQGVILPIILIAAASIITVLVIRRKRKQNLVDKKTD